MMSFARASLERPVMAQITAATDKSSADSNPLEMTMQDPVQIEFCLPDVAWVRRSASHFELIE